ncbi:hypothetical protein [Streptomyces sp. N35]|uniref:hypothetical protein n=1 Tax=Streptomyces sp. N35 TaxID=2795730 RepID=UPI0018F4749A|nr:hypothetical protein [Streptomyces sp. N35]
MTSDGATPTSTTVTTTATTTAATTPVKPTTLRVLAGVGMALVAPVWFLCAMLAVFDAYQGRGSAGPLVDAGFALLWPAFFVGVFALVMPGESVTPKVRARVVRAQYALLLLAPLLILLDGDA